MLIDDDDVDLLQYERQIRRHRSFGEVFTFHRPEDALTYLGKQSGPRVDVLLLDMKMPTMSGFEFLKTATAELGTGYVGTVALLTTLSLSEMHLERATSDPMIRAYLRKPLTTKDLDRLVKIAATVRAEEQAGALDLDLTDRARPGQARTDLGV